MQPNNAFQWTRKSCAPLKATLDAMDPKELDRILENNFSHTDDVFIGKNKNEREYIENAIKSIRAAKCAPFVLRARVVEPGFFEKAIGDIVEGYCLAQEKDYWLVYEPREKTFYCFWGTSIENLEAHGVCGNALYCWTA